MAKINGEIFTADGTTVSGYLDKHGYSKSRVAVELNGEILPKCEYDTTVIQENDSMEVVGFVGGG